MIGRECFFLEAMHLSQLKSKNWIFLFAGVVIAAIPFTVMQLQSQQELRQRADTVTWSTSQSAATSCPATGSGAIITVKFNNTEPSSSGNSMAVTATDQQTGKKVNMGTIAANQSKTSTIDTGKATLNAGSVRFDLSWANGSSGTDTRSANYNAVSNCNPTPSATPTPKPTTPPTPTPTTPPGVTPTDRPTDTPSPTPTICPTVGPVKNIHIDCPNCQ
jgi:hypothetical protein